jgi:hypothetical protein
MRFIHVLLISLAIFVQSGIFEQDKVIDTKTKSEFSTTITDPITLKTCHVSEVGYLKQYVGKQWYLAYKVDDEYDNWILGGAAIYYCENKELYVQIKTYHVWSNWFNGILLGILSSWTNPDKTPFVTQSEFVWVKEMTNSIDRLYKYGTYGKMHYSTDGILSLYIKDELKFQRKVPSSEFYRIHDIFKKSAFIKNK